VLVVGFIAPIPFVSRNGRSRTLATLKRISIGGLAEAQDGKFGDILLADALTSYAKVLGDLFISLCMFFSSKHSSTGPPNRNCGGAFWVPFVISIPSLIRLRQCLIEYYRVQAANQRTGHVSPTTGWGGVHLANALKYSTAFPVIILSALQRSPQPSQYGMSEATLFRLWLVAVLVNSGYSFYWDVARDWDLTLFSSKRERENPEYPWGLRRNRYFHAKEFYYAAIIVDGMLRCTWSFKLSPHLDHFNDLEGGIFLMEVLEVLRRWIWIFFRVETEWGEFVLHISLQFVGVRNADFDTSEELPRPCTRRYSTRRYNEQVRRGRLTACNEREHFWRLERAFIDLLCHRHTHGTGSRASSSHFTNNHFRPFLLSAGAFKCTQTDTT
jgi:hypothetical protein